MYHTGMVVTGYGVAVMLQELLIIIAVTTNVLLEASSSAARAVGVHTVN